MLIYGVFIWLFIANKTNNSISTATDDTTHNTINHFIKSNSASITTSPQYLIVNSGKLSTKINLAEIIYIKSATPYIMIYLANKNYIHSDTLKSIMTRLDQRFFRIHKSCIVNIEHVITFTSRLNGDYDLTLQNGVELRLSRHYAEAFKSVFLMKSHTRNLVE